MPSTFHKVGFGLQLLITDKETDNLPLVDHGIVSNVSWVDRIDSSWPTPAPAPLDHMLPGLPRH